MQMNSTRVIGLIVVLVPSMASRGEKGSDEGGEPVALTPRGRVNGEEAAAWMAFMTV